MAKKATPYPLNGVKVSLEPLNVSADTMAFKDLRQQVPVFEDGVTNIARIFVADEATVEGETQGAAPSPENAETPEATAASEPPSEVTPVRIGRFLMDNTELRFTDRSLTPYYDTRLALADLKVTGLTSEDFKAAEVAANGTIDGYAPVTVTGTINPLAGDLFVGLAVALLKDRKGVIDVNLPVSGRTDDPAFKVTRIVFKALGNLIMKAATSPFSLVGALVGGGEEMRFITFETGRAKLDESGIAKLDGVRKLMAERPALKLEITGYADPEADRRGLAAVALESRIKAPFLAALRKKGTARDSVTLDSVTLSPEQYKQALVKLYKNKMGKKSVENMAEEMAEALVTRLAADVTDADLGLLAKERAEAVKDYLLADGTLTGERVFLKAPANLFKAAEGGFATSRVELGGRGSRFEV